MHNDLRVDLITNSKALHRSVYSLLEIRSIDKSIRVLDQLRADLAAIKVDEIAHESIISRVRSRVALAQVFGLSLSLGEVVGIVEERVGRLRNDLRIEVHAIDGFILKSENNFKGISKLISECEEPLNYSELEERIESLRHVRTLYMHIIRELKFVQKKSLELSQSIDRIFLVTTNRWGIELQVALSLRENLQFGTKRRVPYLSRLRSLNKDLIVNTTDMILTLKGIKDSKQDLKRNLEQVDLALASIG